MAEITLRVNGVDHVVDAEDTDFLLYVLRDQLKLNGPRFGCGLAQCGACTVMIDGVATRSCQTFASSTAGHAIVTLEGLGSESDLSPIQEAFIEEQAAQCGYCINGMIMTAQAFLDQNPSPTPGEIRAALARNLCRCGTHTRIVRAVSRAAEKMAEV